MAYKYVINDERLRKAVDDIFGIKVIESNDPIQVVTVHFKHPLLEDSKMVILPLKPYKEPKIIDQSKSQEKAFAIPEDEFPYDPPSKESFLEYLEMLLNDYDDAVKFHGSSSLDAEECEETLAWVCRGAQRKGWLPEYYTETYHLSNGIRTIKSYNNDLDFWDRAYFDLRAELNPK